MKNLENYFGISLYSLILFPCFLKIRFKNYRQTFMECVWILISLIAISYDFNCMKHSSLYMEEMCAGYMRRILLRIIWYVLYFCLVEEPVCTLQLQPHLVWAPWLNLLQLGNRRLPNTPTLKPTSSLCIERAWRYFCVVHAQTPRTREQQRRLA